MNSQRKFFCFMIWRAQSPFGVIVSYIFSSTHWVRLMFSRTRHRAFDMACDTPIILDFSFSRITAQILIGMLPIRFEMIICTQRRLTIECDQHKCATLYLGQLGKSALSRKKADRDWTKVIVDHKALSEGHETSFKYCQGTFIDVDIYFHQLWGKTVPLVEWFHAIGGRQCLWCIVMLIFRHFVYVDVLIQISVRSSARTKFPCVSLAFCFAFCFAFQFLSCRRHFLEWPKVA